jgi:hypothetical protein
VASRLPGHEKRRHRILIELRRHQPFTRHPPAGPAQVSQHVPNRLGRVTTYASWLNWIEPEFAALRYFALNGTDHHTHAWQGEMIDRYIRWRNARAQPKTSFAPNSVIRTWTGYQINVA